MIELVRLRGEAAEMAGLQRVLEGAPGYAVRVTGVPPGAADAQSLFTSLPPGAGYDDKFVWAVRHGGETIGGADVVRGWPEASTAIIGLLLIDDAHAGRGLGGGAYRAVEREIRAWPGIASVRIGVVRTNIGVLGFWHRMGFVETGEVKPYAHGPLRSETIVLTKAL